MGRFPYEISHITDPNINGNTVDAYEVEYNILKNNIETFYKEIAGVQLLINNLLERVARETKDMKKVSKLTQLFSTLTASMQEPKPELLHVFHYTTEEFLNPSNSNIMGLVQSIIQYEQSISNEKPSQKPSNESLNSKI